jgi:hypothetical protein
MTALASISTPQAAINARMTDPVRTVYVDGVTVINTGVSHKHSVGETATGSIAMLLPRTDVVEPLAAVEIQGGHNDLVATQFSGYIPNWEGSITTRGDLLNVSLVGWSQLLHEPLRDDLVFPGPVAADAVFVALCQLVGVPSWIAETATYPDGVTPLMLGGNNAVDDGAVIIKALQSPLSQFSRIVEPYGYFVTDSPNGAVLFHHVYGLPSGDPVVTFTEGLHFGTARRGYDVRDIVNVWDINGVTYEDEFGGRVPIRSIADPDDVEPHPEIRGGDRYRKLQNSDIVRQDQADAIRNRYEIDYSEATARVRWDGVALPGVNPGDCVAVEAETIEASGSMWLMSVDIDNFGAEQGGYTAGYEGWAGAGDELPGIVDRVTVDIQTDPWHAGDENVSWYAHPAPQGLEKEWPFTIPERASVVNCRGWHHSTNSQFVGGSYTDLDVSKFAIWKAGVDRDNDDNRPESSGSLPRLPEDYALRRPYSRFTVAADGTVTDPGYWSQFAINLRTIDAGDYVLVLTSGVAVAQDDFEVRLVQLEVFGSLPAAGYTGGT